MDESQITFTVAELFAIINLPNKPYAGKMQPSTYFSIRARYANGTLKESTMNNFFKAFGFEPADKRYKSIAPISSEIVMRDAI